MKCSPVNSGPGNCPNCGEDVRFSAIICGGRGSKMTPEDSKKMADLMQKQALELHLRDCKGKPPPAAS